AVRPATSCGGGAANRALADSGIGERAPGFGDRSSGIGEIVAHPPTRLDPQTHWYGESDGDASPGLHLFGPGRNRAGDPRSADPIVPEAGCLRLARLFRLVDRPSGPTIPRLHIAAAGAGRSGHRLGLDASTRDRSARCFRSLCVALSRSGVLLLLASPLQPPGAL